MIKDNVVIHIGLYNLLVIGSFIVATIAAGAAANFECRAHRLLLAHRQVQLRIVDRSGADFASRAASREECDDICEVRHSALWPLIACSFPHVLYSAGRDDPPLAPFYLTLYRTLALCLNYAGREQPH